MGSIDLIHTNPDAMPPLHVTFVFGWVKIDGSLAKGQELLFVSLAILQLEGCGSLGVDEVPVGQESSMPHNPGMDGEVP